VLDQLFSEVRLHKAFRRHLRVKLTSDTHSPWSSRRSLKNTCAQKSSTKIDSDLYSRMRSGEGVHMEAETVMMPPLQIRMLAEELVHFKKC